MNELIEQLVTIIGDYRKEDIGFLYQTKIDKAHIQQWINQFDKEDQEFILSELLHLMPNSYLTKENTLKILSGGFEVLRKDFGYENIANFLNETKFLDCQENQKSQKIFLQYIDELLKADYNISLEDCGKGDIKNWIYFDDVLASGGTFRNNITDEINNFGKEEFKDSEIRIIGFFVILHTWATNNVPFSLKNDLGFDLGKRLKFYRVTEIDNNPNIHPFYRPNPKFNNLYPVESELGLEVLQFIDDSFERTYDMRNEKYAFRNPKYPKEEKFFSSPENRIRYENILLQKGFEIINSIDNLTARSLRPLGMTPPSYKTLGTGTHFFTWRNISNTCPIVFWWGANNWHALFPVKNRGNH